ncbi:hypothetical protein [Acidisoma sp. S159]|uniref:hypothetical protein n=1 Tax=Acidisoma sp. S159 TaxID=1747225 RepID=UPI00131BCA93|nr:hypothetical protein [Acidisoma sp. S159]
MNTYEGRYKKMPRKALKLQGSKIPLRRQGVKLQIWSFGNILVGVNKIVRGA